MSKVLAGLLVFGIVAVAAADLSNGKVQVAATSDGNGLEMIVGGATLTLTGGTECPACPAAEKCPKAPDLAGELSKAIATAVTAGRTLDAELQTEMDKVKNDAKLGRDALEQSIAQAIENAVTAVKEDSKQARDALQVDTLSKVPKNKPPISIVDDNNKASVCTKDNVGKVQYITKEEKFQACVPVGNAFEWAAISSGADEGPYVGLEVTERFEDWLYAGPVGIPTSNRLLGGKSAWNLRDTWSWSTQYDQPNGNEWITGSGGTAVHAGGLFWDGVNDRGGAQYARFDGFVKRNEAVEFFFQEPAVIKEIEINPCCNDDSYRLVKFRLERWSDKDSQWETVSRFYNPSRPDTARLVTGLSGASERAQSWRLLFPRDAIPGNDVPHIIEMIKFVTERNSAFRHTPVEVTLPVQHLDWSKWSFKGTITGGEPTNDRTGMQGIGSRACPDGGYCTYVSSSSGGNTGAKVMTYNHGSNNYWRVNGGNTNKRESFQWVFPKKTIINRVQIISQTYSNRDSEHHAVGAARLQYWSTDDERWVDVAQVRESTSDVLLLFHNLKLKRMLSQHWRVYFPYRAQYNNKDVVHINSIEEIRYMME